jgi:hypothetical protein
LLAVLSRLNSTKMVREFDMVGHCDLEPVRSVYDYPLEALLDVQHVNDLVETHYCWKRLLPNGGDSVGGNGDVGI